MSYLFDNLLDVCDEKMDFNWLGGVKYYANPHVHTPFFERLTDAFKVLTGKCTAVHFQDDIIPQNCFDLV